MKKAIYLVLVILFVSNFCFAQEQPLTKYDFGIEGGPNISFMYGKSNTIQYLTSGIGFQGGVSFQINFNKLLSLRTVLSFERKIIKGKGEVTFTDANGKVIGDGTFHDNYDYLVLPILLRANFGNQVRFFVNAGPYFGYLLQAKYFGNITTTGQTLTGSIDKAQKVDIGLSAGIGISIPIKKQFAISVEARNNLSLLPVHKAENGDGSAKFNTTSVLIGFSYGIK